MPTYGPIGLQTYRQPASQAGTYIQSYIVCIHCILTSVPSWTPAGSQDEELLLNYCIFVDNASCNMLVTMLLQSNLPFAMGPKLAAFLRRHFHKHPGILTLVANVSVTFRPFVILCRRLGILR